MKTYTLAFCAILLASVLLSCIMSPEKKKDLAASDLITEYERLIPINQQLNQGRWAINASDCPRTVGNYQSRQVAEEFICGDVCPQYGSVIIVYSGISESDCASVSGDVIYSHFWGPQYQGCSPLAVRIGTLAQTETSSWSIVGETVTSTRTAYNTPLVFDTASECRKDRRNVACSGFAQGQSVKVVGLNSGDAILVLTLDI